MKPASFISSMGFLFAILAGCAAAPVYVPDPQPLETGRLPAPDVTINIPGLGPCTDAAHRSVHVNSREPVTVLVHGCKGSAANVTRRDAEEFLPLAAAIPITLAVETFCLEKANDALMRLKRGAIRGAAVLTIA